MSGILHLAPNRATGAKSSFPAPGYKEPIEFSSVHTESTCEQKRKRQTTPKSAKTPVPNEENPTQGLIRSRCICHPGYLWLTGSLPKNGTTPTRILRQILGLAPDQINTEFASPNAAPAFANLINGSPPLRATETPSFPNELKPKPDVYGSLPLHDLPGVLSASIRFHPWLNVFSVSPLDSNRKSQYYLSQIAI